MIRKTIAAMTMTAVMMASPMASAGTNVDTEDDIDWVFTVALNDGQDAAFTSLMGEMVKATKLEAGSKKYEFFRNGESIEIHERYESNADAGIHLGNFGANFATRFLSIVTPVSLLVRGPVEGPVREGLAGLGAVFYERIGGYGR